MSYRLRGRFFEACDCHVPCPCWFDAVPDEEECTGLVGWQIENGAIDGLDVTGMSVVSVSRHIGHRDERQMQIALFIDRGARDDQREALASAFTGRLGGPLGELADLAGRPTTVDAGAISFVLDGDSTRLSVGKFVSVAARLVRGSTGEPTTIGDGALATLLGTPGTVGRSEHFRLTVSGIDGDIAVEDRSTTSGRFRYDHRG